MVKAKCAGSAAFWPFSDRIYHFWALRLFSTTW